MSQMRIAVAGTGDLARLIAQQIHADTSHLVLFLSRYQQPHLASLGYQIAIVDYNNAGTLLFALRGVDTVISTVSGESQLFLIEAAVRARVRRFAPAEFEGLPSSRLDGTPLARGRALARHSLDHFSRNIVSTRFVCGIFYERFQPGGLAHSGVGPSAGVGSESDYIFDFQRLTTQAPAFDRNREMNVAICMTSLRDVARFVTRALDMPSWPPELRMCGRRIGVADLVSLVQTFSGHIFDVQGHCPGSLTVAYESAITQGDVARQAQLSALLDTADGRFDFTHANLNDEFPDIIPLSFETWFTDVWNLQ